MAHFKSSLALTVLDLCLLRCFIPLSDFVFGNRAFVIVMIVWWRHAMLMGRSKALHYTHPGPAVPRLMNIKALED
ncbi:hypothetical protein F5Y06DRAFT_273753 [Hypoxylon sp. FL0890]|nr:hypothetical protein F5Y06DRAFT_273753 [Hypoxylon sp. FL0890]